MNQEIQTRIKKYIKFEVHDGVIWNEQGNRQAIIDCDIADRIAVANGHYCAEQFVKAYAGQRGKLDSDTLKVLS